MIKALLLLWTIVWETLLTMIAEGVAVIRWYCHWNLPGNLERLERHE